jgi:phage shock protein PspC (stress-responsive transcriptional regulator)
MVVVRPGEHADEVPSKPASKHCQGQLRRHMTEEGTDMNQIHASFAGNGLVRPRQDRLIGGVCAGVGRRFGIAPWLVRVLFVVACVVLPGSQLVIYPILWVLMPEEPQQVYQHTVTVGP